MTKIFVLSQAYMYYSSPELVSPEFSSTASICTIISRISLMQVDSTFCFFFLRFDWLTDLGVDCFADLGVDWFDGPAVDWFDGPGVDWFSGPCVVSSSVCLGVGSIELLLLIRFFAFGVCCGPRRSFVEFVDAAL